VAGSGGHGKVWRLAGGRPCDVGVYENDARQRGEDTWNCILLGKARSKDDKRVSVNRNTAIKFRSKILPVAFLVSK
jgi:hypothetical protein